MRKKMTALLLACLLLVCLVLPVSAADAPALYGTANAADGTVTVTLSLRGGSAVRSGAFTLSYDSSLTLSKTEKGLPLAVANTKEKGKVVCNWVGGAAEADQAVLTLTFTNAATKSYTFKVSGAKVTSRSGSMWPATVRTARPRATRTSIRRSGITMLWTMSSAMT